MKSLSPLRGTFWVLVAVMSVFVMASSSPQCARSNDLALNPTLQNTGDAFGFCKQECIDQFQLDKKAEQGSDLLEEMSARVGERIARARRKLAELVDEVGPL